MPSFPGSSHVIAESLAEGQDALAQPDWGRSLCPHFGLVHLEFAFVFPPRPLLAKTVAKARADGLRGVMVLPFATSDPVWPTVAAASLTHVQGQLDPCIIIFTSPAYVRHACELLDAERLAVMAVDFPKPNPKNPALNSKF